MSAAPEVVCDADMSTSRYRQREGGVVESVLSESQVVLATCHSAGGRQLRSQSFDVVIIDEATQAAEPGETVTPSGDVRSNPPSLQNA